MTRKKLIRGAGGGKGGGGSSFVEATDSLHSKQFARVIDLVSEGPIIGLVNGAKSVFLNETPLQNTDGTYNFVDFGLNWTTGTQTQLTKSTLASTNFGFADTRAEIAVGTQVLRATPIVRSISTPNLNTIVVTVYVPVLLSRDKSNGNTNPSTVDLTIDLQTAGGGFVNKITDTISGKTTSKYQRSYAIDVSGAGPWDIRVTRVTADSTTQLLENQLWWDTYSTVIAKRLTYPNSALIAASVDSQQFQSIPSRAYDIKGLIVKIPSNYNPATRVYTGSWDGTFVPAWTDNPAWCFYDMLTSTRYGLGDYIDASQVDKWGLYTIAQYCDQLVPSGIGAATEPRFTCNLYLQSPAEAYTVLQNMASIFRAITYWASGSIYVVQDSPTNPAAQFTNANVIDGAFTYAGVSIKARHTVAQIAWNDPADFYRQKIEYVQDDAGVATYGIKRADVVAFGCTSRGQANRLGKWLLYSEKAETETVTFKAGLDGFNLYPGAIIKTSDRNRAGTRMAGRIVAATAATATLDAPVTIAAGKTYTIQFVLPDGTLAKSTVTTATSTTANLTFNAIAQTPQVNSVFLFEANDLVSETWRVISLADSAHNIIEVAAVKHDATKFAQIELGQQFDAPIITALTARPGTPTNLAQRTSPYSVNGAVVGLRTTLSWTSKETRFRVRWRQAGGIWNEKVVTEGTIDIDSVDLTAYEFQVYAINQIGRESDAAILNVTLSVPPAELPVLTGLALEVAFTSKQCKIKWNAVPGATSYLVEVRDTASNTSRRIVNVGNALRFDYTSADTRADGGPWRALTFYVTPQGQFGSASLAPGTLAVSNPQIGAVNGVTVTGGIKTVFVNYATPADPDFIGVQAWLSVSSTFTPDATNLVYDGNDTLLVFRALTDGTPLGAGNYYLKIAGYDDFGKDGLTISGSIAVAVSASAPDANSIVASMIQDGILNVAKFAAGIAPVGLVTALPAVAGYTGPLVVYNTTDGKIYRLTGGAWVTSVVASDVSGSFVDAQLASIAAAKVTGTLTDTQLSAISAAKITGTLSDTQIAAISAAKVTGTLTDTQIAGLAAAKVTGQITGTQITDGAISTPKIATGAVVAGSIAAGAITTAALSVGTGRNLLRYSSWQQGTGIAGWSLGYNTAALTATPFTGQVPSILRRATGDTYSFNGESGDMNYGFLASASLISGQSELNHSQQIGVQAGAAYEASVYLLTHRCTAQISMVFLDVNGAQTASNSIQNGNTVATGSTPGNDLNNYGRSLIVGVAPATAVKALILIRCFYSSSSQPFVFFARAYFGEASPNQTTATPWSPAGVTQIDGAVITTGTVTAAQITAGTITANEIAGQTITAAKIASNTITASQILAGTITGNEIAATTITGSKIVGGTITATQIGSRTITAGLIAAGAITANEIQANTITAGQIAAGAITANQIAAKAITVDKIAIGDFSNLVENPNFELGDIGWPIKEGGWYIAQGSLGAPYNGLWYGQLPAGAPTSALRSNNKFNIAAGDTFYGKAYLGSNSSHSYGYIRLTLQNSGGGLETSIAASTNAINAFWTLHEFTATITPAHIAAGYVTARFEVVGNSQQAGWTASDGVAVDGCGLFRMSGATLIQDGAIQTNKIAASAITADKILANSITADRILANSLTAAQIQAGSITADRFTSGVGGTNIIPNASFAAQFPGLTGTANNIGVTSADGWSAYRNSNTDPFAFGINYAGTGWNIPGDYTLQFLQAGTSTVGNMNFANDFSSVVGGAWYEMSAYTGAHRCNVYFYVQWLDSTGAYLAIPAGSPTYSPPNNSEKSGGQDLNGYKRLFMVTQAPSTAVRGRIVMVKDGTTSGTDSWIMFTRPYMGLATGPNQTVASPYSPNGLGTQISGSIIKTGTITAASGQIADLAVTTLKIAGEAVVVPRFISGYSLGAIPHTSLVSGYLTLLDIYVDFGANAPSLVTVVGVLNISSNSNTYAQVDMRVLQDGAEQDSAGANTGVRISSIPNSVFSASYQGTLTVTASYKPSSGSHRYQLIVGIGNGSGVVGADSASMIISGAKR